MIHFTQNVGNDDSFAVYFVTAGNLFIKKEDKSTLPYKLSDSIYDQSSYFWCFLLHT